MPLLMFLNERSCETTATPDAVGTAMADFVDVVRHISHWRETALWTQTPITGTELAQGYTYGQWASDRRNVDRHRYLLAKRSRAPFKGALPDTDTEAFDEYECRHAGQLVEGLKAALISDGLGLSLALAPQWAAAWLDLAVRHLDEDTDGSLVLRESDRKVRHCATIADAGEHADWIRSNGLLELTSPRLLWEARAEHFPALQFLPRVEKDLQSLSRVWLTPTLRLLADLQSSVASWDPALSAFPCWRAPHITPEAEQRKRLCVFSDLDGVSRTFDLHGRMTPGAGRLHFRLVPEEGTLRIAYIGPKL
jgi:hypothetical protein